MIDFFVKIKKIIVKMIEEQYYEYEYGEKYKEENKKEYIRLKCKLENWSTGKKRKYSIIAGLFTIIATLTSFLETIDAVLVDKYKGTILEIIFALTLSFIMGLIMASIVSSIIESYINSISRKVFEYEIDNIQDKVKNDIFENLIKLSYKYLDQYYLQTRKQAQKGFWITVCVSVFGAILIGIGIVALYLGNTEPSHVTCASGVITEFIAAIFFWLYNKTIIGMSKYPNKLVLSHNISIALKVADSLPDTDKAESKKIIISELLKDINTYLIKSDVENNRN